MILEKTKVAIVGEDWDVIDLIEHLPEFELIGVYAPTMAHPEEFSHLGTDEEWKSGNEMKIVLAVDIPRIRAKLFNHYNQIITLVSPQCYVSTRASIEEGSVIQRGVTLMPHVKLGKACKVNINATLHHDVKLGDFCTVAPGALILGNVIIEEGAYIGAGAIIKQRCRIGAYAMVGAGAVVVSDVPAETTVVGVPAKSLLSRS